MGVWEWEREWIIPFPKFGNGKGMEKTIPKIWKREGNEKNIPNIQEWEGNEKIYSQNSGTGREGKKSNPTFQERESEAIIPRYNWEKKRKKTNKIFSVTHY